MNRKITDRANFPPSIDWDRLPLMLDEKQVAAAAGVSLSFLQKARLKGSDAPPFVRVGGRVLYRVSDIKAWVAALEGRRFI